MQMGNDISIPSNGMITVLKMICNSKDLNESFKIERVFFSFPTFEKKVKLKKTIKAVFIFFRKLPPVDIIHIHHSTGFNFFIASYFAIVGRFFKKKIIFHNHGADFVLFFQKSGWMTKFLIKKVFELVDLTIVLSESWYKWHYNVVSKKAKWVILKNPSPLKQPNFTFKETKNKLLILYMSRLEKRKGVYDLIDIIPEIIKNHKNLYFCFAGDGDFKEVHSLIQNRKISDNARVIGWINDKTKLSLLLKTHIFVLPSYNEGLPMALLEAMTYGIPCVATNVGGIPELIKNNKNGLLFRPGDKITLRDNILQLIENSDIRFRIGNSAYKTIEKEFTLQSYIIDLSELYSNLIRAK